MSDTQTEQDWGWNPQNGGETTYVIKSFEAYPTPPSGARNVKQTQVDGEYITTYTLLDGDGTIYTINGNTSQEPLATHPMFGPTGSFYITDSEWKQWKLWEGNHDDTGKDASGWDPSSSSASAGMNKFYNYYNKGITDYLKPSCTVKIKTEGADPDISIVGTIATPEYIPTGATGTWLCTGCDAETANDGLWQNIYEYRMGLWDTEIYSS